MKANPTALLALVAALTTTAAHAQVTSADSKVYGEAGFTVLNYKTTDAVDGSSIKSSPRLATAAIGYAVHPNLALEAYFGFGAGKDKVSAAGANTATDMKAGTMVGLFLRPRLAIGDRIELFGRAGWAFSRLTLSGAGVSESDSDDDFGLGFGANYNISPSSYLQVSWTQFYNNKDTTIRGLGVAYGLRF